jgi:hypothetical protein
MKAGHQWMSRAGLPKGWHLASVLNMAPLSQFRKGYADTTKSALVYVSRILEAVHLLESRTNISAEFLAQISAWA